MKNIFKETINNELIKYWWSSYTIVDIQTEKRKGQINFFYPGRFWEGYKEYKYYNYKSYFKIMQNIYRIILDSDNFRWLNFHREIHRKRVKRYQ